MLWLLCFGMIGLKNMISKRLAFERKWKVGALVMEIVRLVHSLKSGWNKVTLLEYSYRITLSAEHRLRRIDRKLTVEGVCLLRHSNLNICKKRSWRKILFLPHVRVSFGGFLDFRALVLEPDLDDSLAQTCFFCKFLPDLNNMYLLVPI